MLKIENVSKIYKSLKEKVVALDNVSIEFPNKGLVFICGKNGHGKSTLLNCISLLDENYDGNIYINEKSYKELSEKEKINLKKNTFGYIFQHSNLIEDLTCENNINISTKIFKEKRLENIEVDSQIPLSHYPREMSGGQQQKAAIYRALKENKKILICDEPTASLDYKNTILIIEELKKISKDKLVICVSHNMDLIEKYADRIIKIENGKIIQDEVINFTDDLDIKNKDDNSKISYINLFKIGLSFFKNKVFLSIIYLIISCLFLFIIMTLTSIKYNNYKSQISNKIEEYAYDLELCYDQTTIYNDGTKFKFKSGISDEMLSNCEKYLINDYSVSCEEIKFIKNSGIKIKEAYIGEKDYYNSYKGSFNEPITKTISFNGGSIELKIIGTFRGTGLICDYESISLIKKSNSIEIKGGIWLNAKIDGIEYDINEVLDKKISYESVSSFNEKTGNNYVLNDNEVILTDYLKSFDEDNPIKEFFSFNDFSNSDALYNYIDMNKIFPNGIKTTENTMDDGYFRIVVSDEKYDMILNEYNIFDHIYVDNSNPNEITDMIIENEYYFNENNRYDNYYNINYSLGNLESLIGFCFSIKHMKCGFLIAIGCCIIILAFISFIFISIIYKNESIKIGVFRCLGLSKFQSIFSTFISFIILLLTSTIFSLLLFVFLVKNINTAILKILIMDDIIFIKFSFSAFLICLITLLIILIIFVFYSFIMLKSKQTKDYFSVD